jgi:hypothetical protein
MNLRPLTPGTRQLIGKRLKWNARINLCFSTPLFRFIPVTAGAFVNVNLSIALRRHFCLPSKKLSITQPIAIIK